MHVLILDDREEDLAALDAIVSSRGHAVTRAARGEEGLRALRGKPADLIVCDALLEGMDGAELLKEIRKDPATARVPFYIATARAIDAGDEKFYNDLGASGFINKPYDPRVIQKVLEDAAPGAGKLNLGVPAGRPMGDDTFVERNTERLVDKLEKMVLDLQAGTRFLDEVLNAMEQPVFVIGEDFRILRANTAAARRLGLAAAAELNGRSCYRTIWGAQTPCAFDGHACPLKPVIFEKKAVRHEAAFETTAFNGRFAITFNACAAHPDTKTALVEQVFDAPAPAVGDRPAVMQVVSQETHALKNTLTGVVGYAQLLLDEIPAGHPQRKVAETLARLVDKAAAEVKIRPDDVPRIDTTAAEPPKAGSAPKPKPQPVAPPPAVKPKQTKAPSPAALPMPVVEVKPVPEPVAAAAVKPAVPLKEPDISGISLPPLPAGSPSIIDGTVQTRTPQAGTVMLVDDEEALLDVGKRTLEKHRVNVVTASDIDEALIIFEARRDEIDVVVLDLVIPGQDGVKSFEQFMSIDEHARVIVAGPAGPDKQPAVQVKGALAYLRKPYDAAALLAAVQAGFAKPLPPEKAIRKSQLPHKARMRVLLVDDEELVLKTLDRGLRRDFDIVALTSAQAAMDLLGLDRDFDWIISDLNMPGKSGLDLHAHIAEKTPALAGKVVFLTGGAASLELCERLAGTGLVSFEKPVNSDVLRAHLKGEPPPAQGEPAI